MTRRDEIRIAALNAAVAGIVANDATVSTDFVLEVAADFEKWLDRPEPRAEHWPPVTEAPIRKGGRVTPTRAEYGEIEIELSVGEINERWPEWREWFKKRELPVLFYDGRDWLPRSYEITYTSPKAPSLVRVVLQLDRKLGG